MGLAVQVTQALRGGDRHALDGDLVVPVALPVEEQPTPTGSCQACMSKPAVAAWRDGGHQDLALGREPGQRLR